MTSAPSPLGVLISGGLDSAILLGSMLSRGVTVHPLFIRCGHWWEGVELDHLQRFLQAVPRPTLMPLRLLDQPVGDLYHGHWSLTGVGVPKTSDPDEMVFLPGRNVLLLGKAILWCHLSGIPALALGSLQTNPFPDATPEFFRTFTACVNRAVEGKVEVLLPLGGMKKREVMLLGRDLPLEHTFSCIQPTSGLHCGQCNKCGERREAFRSAELVDPTTYASDLTR